MIRVVIADDQAMVRSGLRSLLADEPEIDVVGEAADGRTALDVVRRRQPDVVLMDIRMPVLDGLSATRELVAADIHVRILVLTTFDLDEYVFEALRAGASGLLLKDATARELEVLELVARGLSNAEIARELYISDATAKTHVSSVLNKLGLRDRVQAVICAYERGLVAPRGPDR